MEGIESITIRAEYLSGQGTQVLRVLRVLMVVRVVGDVIIQEYMPADPSCWLY